MPGKDAAHTKLGSGEIRVIKSYQSEHMRVSTGTMVEEQVQSEASTCILVVEDDPALASLEATFLAAHGYVVEIAGNAEQAISALQQRIPDLVVLDLELPGTLTGWHVLEAVRQNAHIPVLLTTSWEANIRKNLRSFGETRLTLDHLPKPYPMQTLLKRVERMLTIAP